jgi:GrpB-like predicted nucleotidyltransferase (UPF0157 family)
MYEEEKAAILRAIGSRLVAIEHVGSTAVPGLGAKPIVDIMAGLPSLADAADCIAPLEALGYHFVPEVMRDLPDDRYFERWTERTAQSSPKSWIIRSALGDGRERWTRRVRGAAAVVPRIRWPLARGTGGTRRAESARNL